jgi:hypothetical protein
MRRRIASLFLSCSVVGALLTVASCSGKQRAFAEGESTVGDAAGGVPASPAPDAVSVAPGAATEAAPGTSSESTALTPGIDLQGGEGSSGSACSESCTDEGCDAGGSPCSDLCEGCMINGECVAAGTANPLQLCQICDPSLSELAWSSNDGIVCDDGLFCTVDDTCSAGRCEGLLRSCEDGSLRSF